MAHEVDEPGDHEHGVKVELELGVALPGEGLAVLGVVLDHPVQDQAHDAVEQDLGHEDEEAEPAAGAGRHAVVVMLAVSEREVEKMEIEIRPVLSFPVSRFRNFATRRDRNEF